MEFQHIVFDRRDGVARLVLNKPPFKRSLRLNIPTTMPCNILSLYLLRIYNNRFYSPVNCYLYTRS